MVNVTTHKPELLTGVEEIAEFFGWPPRRTYYLLSTGQLSCAFRIGKFWHMRPATGRAWLASHERKQAGDDAA
jgi:hypothetical protein